MICRGRKDSPSPAVVGVERSPVERFSPGETEEGADEVIEGADDGAGGKFSSDGSEDGLSSLGGAREGSSSGVRPIKSW